MIETASEFAERYASALRDYVGGGGEAALHRAYELGRKALDDGLGVLDIAAVHCEAVAGIVPVGTGGDERGRMTQAIGTFFAESLSPFEMAYRGVREANTALRRLNERLEEEIRRIARSLHDEAGQLLANVYLAIGDVAEELTPGGREHLGRVRQLLDGIDEQLRRIARELRPVVLDELGLVAALDALAEGLSKRTGLSVSVEGPGVWRLPPRLEITLYRVVQDALTNVLRHARATRAVVHLQRDDRELRCVVRDDGVGFDVARVSGGDGRRGLGLVLMRERLQAVGGRLSIASTNGQGTSLTMVIPLEP